MTPAQKKVYDHVLNCLCSGEYLVDATYEEGIKWGNRTQRAYIENNIVYEELVKEGQAHLWDDTWKQAANDYKNLPLVKALR